MFRKSETVGVVSCSQSGGDHQWWPRRHLPCVHRRVHGIICLFRCYSETIRILESRRPWRQSVLAIKKNQLKLFSLTKIVSIIEKRATFKNCWALVCHMNQLCHRIVCHGIGKQFIPQIKIIDTSSSEERRICL